MADETRLRILFEESSSQPSGTASYRAGVNAMPGGSAGPMGRGPAMRPSLEPAGGGGKGVKDTLTDLFNKAAPNASATVSGLKDAFGASGSAGMVAGGFAAAFAAAKAVASGFDAVGAGAKSVGVQMSALADNDHMGAFKARIDASANMLEKLPGSGEVAASALRAFRDVVDSASSTVDAFVSQGKKLAGLNADIGMSSAVADVRSLLGDIREANALGGEYAELIDSQSRIMDEIRQLILPFKEAVLKILNELVKLVIDGIEWAKQIAIMIRDVLMPFIEAGANTLKAIAAFLPQAAAQAINASVDAIVEALKKFAAEQGAVNGLGGLEQVLAMMGAPAIGGPAPVVPGGGGLGVPVFGG